MIKFIVRKTLAPVQLILYGMQRKRNAKKMMSYWLKNKPNNLPHAVEIRRGMYESI